jgi:hypothetical protein
MAIDTGQVRSRPAVNITYVGTGIAPVLSLNETPSTFESALNIPSLEPAGLAACSDEELL